MRSKNAIVLAASLILSPAAAAPLNIALEAETAMNLRNQAVSYSQEGYYNKAEASAKRALDILEHCFGPNDMTLVPALNVLGETYIAQGRYVDAKAALERAVAIGTVAGAHYGTALHNLAAVYQCEGKLDKARDLYERALVAREATLPAGHPFIAATQTALESLDRKSTQQRKRFVVSLR